MWMIEGSVKNTEGVALEGIVVQLLGSCTAGQLGTATTDSQGNFLVWGPYYGTEDSKLRLSDPAGYYRTSFYGITDDDFIAAPTVATTPVYPIMLPAPPDIEVRPLIADFGNVELPGSTTTIVTIANRGGSDLHVSELTLLSGSNPDISIQSSHPLPVTLAPGASCEGALEFEPHELGSAGATLAVVSDDPDEGTVQVALTGQGVASEAPPAEQLAAAVAFYEEAAAEGTLQGTGPGGAADAHLQALLNQLTAASELAAAGKLAQACQQLKNALLRTDGDPQPPDFVTGPAAAELRLLIELTRLAIGCD